MSDSLEVKLLALTRLAEERLHLALDAGRMGTWQFDLKNGKVTWSSTLEAIHGIPIGSFGGTFADYQRDIHPDDRERVLATIEKSSEGQSEHHLTYRIVRPDGQVRWLEASGRLFKNAAGQPELMMGVCCDITERVEAEAQRQELLRQAEAAVRARDDMLAMVSHDLRNPLGVIAMAAEQLAAELSPSDPRSQPLIERVSRAAKRMDELISNLLDAASIEAGNFEIQSEELPLEQLLNDSVEAIQPLAARRSIALEIRLADRALRVHCDPHRIAQVLGNLLGNAVKFSPEGSQIVVEASRESNWVQIAVHDRGPGIAAEHLELLFDRYWTGKRSGRAGTGIGLFIARGIVLAHGGKIWAQSTQGEGSSFYFNLPLAGCRPLNDVLRYPAAGAELTD